MHGRPRPFDGEWYSSLFVHYRPREWPLRTQSALDALPLEWWADWASDMYGFDMPAQS